MAGSSLALRCALLVLALTLAADAVIAQEEPVSAEPEPSFGEPPPQESGSTPPVGATTEEPAPPLPPTIPEPTKDETSDASPVIEQRSAPEPETQSAGEASPARRDLSLGFAFTSENVMKALGGVGSTALGAWGLVKARQRAKKLARLIDRVEKAYRVERDDPRARGEMERLRDEFKGALSRADLDEKHFILLDDRIRDRQGMLARSR